MTTPATVSAMPLNAVNGFDFPAQNEGIEQSRQRLKNNQRGPKITVGNFAGDIPAQRAHQ